MLGSEQLEWLIRELTTSSADHALVVWVNPTPWIAPDGSGSDDWSAFADERRFLADAIASVDNLVMVSGDAHMVAIDDGTNSDMTSADVTPVGGAAGKPGFPLLHAAALDRPGAEKGGPYSHGAIADGGQFGVIEVVDNGADRIDVTLRGVNWAGVELMALEFEVEVDPALATDGR